jgi:hypothetical protein
MNRIRIDALRPTLLAAALHDELQVAAGRNVLLSRAEQEVLAADLQQAARIARSRAPGRPISVHSVAAILGEQVDAALEAVNQPVGSGRPFLSRAERARIGDQEPLIGARVERAVAALFAVPAPTIVTDGATVKAELDARLASWFFDGLLGSEGGEPVSTVLLPPLPWPATGAQLARALGHDPKTPRGAVERYRAADDALLTAWLGQQQAPADDIAHVDALLRGLVDRRLLILGEDGGEGVPAAHPTYIVGAAADGTIVGIRTDVIWT